MLSFAVAVAVADVVVVLYFPMTDGRNLLLSVGIAYVQLAGRDLLSIETVG